MQLIEFPRSVPIEEYHAAIESVSSQLIRSDGCVSVYQIGGLSSPGISDIDLVAVYENERVCNLDPRRTLTSAQRYLFPHTVFAASRELFHESQRCVFFHNYRHLKGADILSEVSHASDDSMLHQSANEYLVRMYVNHMVERTFGVCKVRNMLLNAKALQYDIQFLGVEDSRLKSLISRIIDWRSNWFQSRPSDDEIKEWHKRFWTDFNSFLAIHFETSAFYLPETVHRMGRSIEIRKGNPFQSGYRGFKFPWMPAKGARQSISLLHRIGKFTVQIPYESGGNVPSCISESFDYVRRAKTYNETNLPHFMPLTTSLALQA